MNSGSLIIYRASAGAGKTFTLVKEYLKIVLVNPYDFRHVLAITFTNKATEEMKSRIMATLSEMAAASPQEIAAMPMFQDIKPYLLSKQYRVRSTDHSNNQTAEQSKESGIEGLVKANARKTLHLILADYSNFSVSTIESFFQKIIRAFSRELNVPLGYEIDMRQDVVLEEIMQSTLRDAGREPEITALLGRFLERNLQEEKGWRIESGIRKLGRQLFTEQFQTELVKDQHMLGAWREQLLELEKELRKLVAITDNRLQSLAKEAIGAIEMTGLTIKDFSYGMSGPVGHFYKVRDKKEYVLGKRAEKAATEGEGWVKKTGAKADARILAEETLTDILLQIHDTWTSQKTRYTTAKILLKHMHEFALMFDLQERLASYREDKGRLMISDTNLLLKQVVGDQETPFVYEKVGNRYHYFLIDEFQDTSDLQWSNLFPLIINVLALGNHSLLVGDVKQSIFRWRNGNPELLMFQAQEEIARSGAQVDVRRLESNWRTAPRIVDFNNRFFPVLTELFADEQDELGKLYLKNAYLDVAQKPQRTETEGFVSVESYAKEVDKVKQNWEQTALDRTLAIIREAEQDGFSRNDIAMLVRENKHAGMVASFLQEHGYKVASPDALLISNDTAVRFLVAAIRWLDDETEKLHEANLAFFYHQLAPDASRQFHDVFAQSTEAIPFRLSEEAGKLRRMAVLPCLERICQLFPVLQEPNAFVTALLEQALDFSAKQDASLAGFLGYWDEEGSGRKVAVGEEEGALQLMTIHKAKGLEFPVVIMPFADWPIRPKPTQWLWVSTDRDPFDTIPFYPINYSSTIANSYFSEAYTEENLKTSLDNLNLLYVAFTRPQYRLYIITFHGRKSSSRFADYILAASEQLAPDTAEENEHTRLYRWGNTVPKKAIASKHKEAQRGVSLAPNPDPLLPWEGAVRIRLGVGRFLRADRLTQEAAASAGELLHEALARVHVTADVPQAVAQLVSKGLLAQQDAAVFSSAVTEKISESVVASWFDGSWQVQTEASIILEGGKVLRPDRVIQKDNTIIVIDYKTGLPRDSHQKQVAGYVSAIRDLSPEAEVKGCLYYTDRAEVTWV